MKYANPKTQKFEELRVAFALQLPQRIASAMSEWDAYKRSNSPAQHHDKLCRTLHGLAGVAGTFGFAALGEKAHALEHMLRELDDNAVLDADEIVIFEAMFDQMGVLAHKRPEKIPVDALSLFPESAAEPEAEVHIHLVEDDAMLAELLAQQLLHYGYRVTAFSSAEDFSEGSHERPAARIVDVVLPEGNLEGPRVMAELRKGTGDDVPTVFFSVRNDWQARLMAVRAGGSAYFAKPVDMMALVEHLDRMVGRVKEAVFRVMIVEDDPLLGNHYAAVLHAAGMETLWLEDQELLLDTLSDFRPDLVLMDIYMNGTTGVECVQVIRQYYVFDNLPVVFLSSESTLQRQLEALTAGADDFLQKPIADAHLVLAVKTRARRFRRLNSLMSTDGLTGLLNHVHVKLALSREYAANARREGQLCFAMIDLDLFKCVNDTYSHMAGDLVLKSLAHLLRSQTRRSDIVGRYGGEEFAIILPDTSLDDAITVVDQIRERFAQITHSIGDKQFKSTFSAGVAVGLSGGDVVELIHAADNALYAAKDAGRNMVMSAR